ncbi:MULTISPECIES: hypothetical protein [Pseudomonas]|uniref:Uncharacterized protein n=1 Tax=Pseudomonas nitroreducens TaxID=46680 RepID=A0A6G6J845_PSENT|nr:MULTISPECIES: hypothetical protein [Pseudomonas]MDU4254088.1 hypothetical protein [Pseudomonas sp.]QIE91555.1 hypothetical protein G5B91_35070 [Pseudomonas nitroreducens]
MKKEVRDSLSKDFVQQLERALAAREETLNSIEQQVLTMAAVASDLLMGLEIELSHFPLTIGEKTCSTFWKWSPAKRSAGSLRLYLKCNDYETGRLASRRMVIQPSAPGDVGPILEDLLGKRQSGHLLRMISEFLDHSDRASRWAHQLAGAETIRTEEFGSVISAWVGLLAENAAPAATRLRELITRFNAVDDELRHAVFEFNESSQPVRYGSIICRPDVSPSDPLGPTEPVFRVVTYFNRATGKRQTTPIAEYKRGHILRELRASLTTKLGREPEPAEVEGALQGQRRRSTSPWITREVISHCYLGKHSSNILRQQKNIAAFMEEWLALRGQFQALLEP